MIPDNVEKIIMTKEDYDRNVEQLLFKKIELQERIDKAIEYIEKNIAIYHKDLPLIAIDYEEVINILEGKDD